MKWSNKITYLYGCFNGTRMLIGAVNTLFLLDKGVSVGNVALLQMIQTITVLCMEIPTGVIADVISRKLSVLLSCILLVAYYPLICFGAPNMFLMGAGQVIYALALCLVSGAFEGWQTLIIKLEYPKNDNKLNYYGHLKYEINSFVTMFSGTIGSIIVYVHGGGYSFLFVLCSVIMLFLFFEFLKIPYPQTTVKRIQHINFYDATAEYKLELKAGLKHCFSTVHGWFYFMGLSLLVCSYQVVYYYWQPYFSILATKNLGVNWIIHNNELLMGLVFFTYCFSRFIMNRFVRKKLLEKTNPFWIALSCLIIAMICTLGFCLLHDINILVHIILFAIIQGTITIVESIFESQYIKKVDTKNISSSLSITSAATSILSIIILALISKLISQENMYLFFLATTFIYLLVALVVFMWSQKYNSLIKMMGDKKND